MNVGASGGNQLVIKVQAMDTFGNIDWINALVDTGAQANLLSTSKFYGGDWQNSGQPLSLLTVTYEPLGGGDKEITLQLGFGVIGGGKWETTGKFHGADIRVDAILSYPWLKEQRLAVCPSSGCLALESSEGPWMRVGDFPDEYSDGSTGMDTCDGDDTQSIEVWACGQNQSKFPCCTVPIA